MTKLFNLGILSLGIAFGTWSLTHIAPFGGIRSSFGMFFPGRVQVHTIKNQATPVMKIAQSVSLTPEQRLFQDVINYAMSPKAGSHDQTLADQPMAEIMQSISEYFLGNPYQENLLDKTKEEKLVITLKGFDCVLFVETVLAIARGIAIKDYSYERLVKNIENQRYWHGEMAGYCSRLHYFSSWIADNDKRGNVKDIAQDLGGIPLNKKLNFMSQHRNSYPQIANDQSSYQCLVDVENRINQLKINYIPQAKIRSIYSQLQPGDIIAVATDIKGLDVTHTGLVYRNDDGNIGFIHASPAGKVTIAYDLSRYISRVENSIGILVARPVDPRAVIPVSSK
jgi:hypothetical protein